MRCLGQTPEGPEGPDDSEGSEENEAVRGSMRPYKELWVKRFCDFRDKSSDQFKMC